MKNTRNTEFVVFRFPMGDLADFPFPHSVPLFCLPMGSTLELWPKAATRPRPVFSTFVLTVSDAKHKVYGSAVTFYEEVADDQVSKEQKELLGYSPDSDYVLNANKSICVLSHWPFSDAFETWLLFLHVKHHFVAHAHDLKCIFFAEHSYKRAAPGDSGRKIHSPVVGRSAFSFTAYAFTIDRSG